MQRPIDTSERINQLLLRASKPHNTPGEKEKERGRREAEGWREGGMKRGSRDKQFGEEDLRQEEEEVVGGAEEEKDHNDDMKKGGLTKKKG